MKPSFLSAVLLFPVLGAAACTAEAKKEQPTTKTNPATPADLSACDASKFEGTFLFAKIEHVGDSPLCVDEASGWNDTEVKREVTITHQIDGTYASVYTEHPEAGITSFGLDPASCSLIATSSTSIFMRDRESNTAFIPLALKTTLTQTSTGLEKAITENLSAVSDISGLPCAITSTTNGVRL